MDFLDEFLSFRWLNRNKRERRKRKPYTTRANKQTKAYRAKRKRRNKAARVSRKINRRRGQ